jgi:hypothetical protein
MMLSKQLEEDLISSPTLQVEYDVFSVCRDIERLCNDYDNDKALEAFLTKQTSEELNLAAVRLTSLAAAITLSIKE